MIASIKNKGKGIIMRLTEEHIKSIVQKTEYKRIGIKTTVCCLTLINGMVGA